MCLYFPVELNQSFDEDEINSNFFSSPLHDRILNESYESHHASLKRKKPEKDVSSVLGSPVIEKSHSMTADILQRPASMVVPTPSETNVSLSPSIGSLNRQVLSNHRQVHSNHRQVHSNIRQVHINNRQVHSNYRQVHSNHRQVHSNHRQVHSNHRQVHCSHR